LREIEVGKGLRAYVRQRREHDVRERRAAASTPTPTAAITNTTATTTPTASVRGDARRAGNDAARTSRGAGIGGCAIDGRR
jgi:hypothetical protein